MSRLFCEAVAEDLDAVWQLIVDRVEWMDKKGIRQWNVTNYLEAFPKEYYLEKNRKETTFCHEREWYRRCLPCSQRAGFLLG